MKELEIKLVKQSWAQVVPIAQEAMAMFYSNLFKLDENIAQLFVGKDMHAQGVRLSSALDLVIGNLERPEFLANRLKEVGARHASYDVSVCDFDTVGKALIMTLENGLGETWTEAHERSWTAAYSFVAEQMIAGLQAKQAAKYHY